MALLELNVPDLNNPDATQEFLDLNALDHNTIHNTLLGLGFTTEQFPLWLEGKPGPDWLFIHDRMHKAECIALGLPTPPDLVDVNFDDAQQSEDWFNNHSLLHSLETQALGI